MLQRAAVAFTTIFCCGAFAQGVPNSAGCIQAIGQVSYPPYSWGFGESRRVNMAVEVDQNGRPTAVEPGILEDQFREYAGRSALASTYGAECRGRKISVRYWFRLEGEKSEILQTTVARQADGIVVTARPPVPTCTSPPQNDDDAEIQSGQADALLNERRYPEALVCAEQALARKGIETAYIAKGVALRKLGRLHEAIRTYDELEKIAPHHKQLFFNRANAYRDLEDREAALRDFSRAIEVMTDPVPAYLNRGNIYLYSGRFELARDDYRKVLELDPEDAKAYTNLCNVYPELGALQDALEACGKAIEYDTSDPAPFNNRAIVWTTLGKFDDAIRDTNTALRMHPRYFEALATRGAAYALSGRLREAAEDISAAIQLQPDCGPCYALRAEVRRQLADYRGADADLKQSTAPGMSQVRRWYTLDPVTGLSKPNKF